MKKALKQIQYILLPVLVALFPIVFLYSQNAFELKFTDLLYSIVFAVALGAVSFIILQVVLKNKVRAAFLSAIFMALCFNFSLLRAFVGGIHAILPYVLFVALLFGAFKLFTKFKESTIQTGISIATLCLGLLICVNFATAIPQIVKRNNVKVDSTTVDIEAVKSNNLPTIYYFIFDEYANFDVVDKHYNFDNKEFYDYLIERNFTVSRTSHNDNIDTMMCLANLYNLDYVTKVSDKRETFVQAINTAKIFDLMKDQGYEPFQISSSQSPYPLTQLFESGDSGDTAVTIDAKTANDLVMDNTIFSVLYKWIKGKLIADTAVSNKEENDPRNEFNRIMDYLCDPETVKQVKGNCIFSYHHTPHVPFVYDENGEPVDYEHEADFTVPDYYLGQYKYTTKRMMEMLNNILKHDPDSIIVLQSDHGVRHAPDDDAMTNAERMNILNAIYFKGELLPEIDGESGINTLRILLSKAYGLDLPVLR